MREGEEKGEGEQLHRWKNSFFPTVAPSVTISCTEGPSEAAIYILLAEQARLTMQSWHFLFFTHSTFRSSALFLC